MAEMNSEQVMYLKGCLESLVEMYEHDLTGALVLNDGDQFNFFVMECKGKLEVARESLHFFEDALNFKLDVESA